MLKSLSSKLLPTAGHGAGTAAAATIKMTAEAPDEQPKERPTAMERMRALRERQHELSEEEYAAERQRILDDV